MEEKQRVLVCGASGFLGRNILGRLQKRENLDVRGAYFTKLLEFAKAPNMSFCNFLNEEMCLEQTQGVDVLVQCAAETAGSGRKKDWPRFACDNIRMNQNLIETAVANGVKHFIFLSCSVMYPVNLDMPVQEEWVDESKIHEGYFVGAKAKLIVEDLMKIHARIGDTHFTSVRHSNIYGPYDKFDLKNSHVMAATIQKTMESRDGQLHMRGGMNTIRDLLYVSDFVNFIEDSVVFGPRGKFNVFNVGSGQGISIGELAEKVVKVSGKNLKVVFEKEKDLRPASIVLDTKKARNITGWRPVVSLEQGIEQTIKWWKETYEHKS